MRDCPFSIIYWFSFDFLRPKIEKILSFAKRNEENDSAFSRFCTDCKFSWSNGSVNVEEEKNDENIKLPYGTAKIPYGTQENVPSKIIPFGAPVNFVSGALSGFLSAVITHPFDVLKTRNQLLSLSPPNPSAPPAIGGLSLASVVREGGGVAALYRGLSMRLCTVIPGGAIMVTVYEYVKSLDI
jgi:hypothetical protein